MNKRISSVAVTVCLAVVLWVIPSVGTHGQGTLGNRFAHADQDVIAATPRGQASLVRADHLVSDAVARL